MGPHANEVYQYQELPSLVNEKTGMAVFVTDGGPEIGSRGPADQKSVRAIWDPILMINIQKDQN